MELRLNDDDALDLPPEFCHYHDEGCDFADSCLNCPLPMCVHDEKGGRRRLLKRQRAINMARLYTTQGLGVKEIAGMFGVSRRTVQRALKLAFNDSTVGEVPEE
jgi:hypothetical protein